MLKAFKIRCEEEIKASANRDSIKVQFGTLDDFRMAQEWMKEQGVPFHTFRLKNEIPLKVVIRGLPADVTPDEIKIELKNRNFDIFKVKTIRQERR